MYFVYELVDPRTNIPAYIGITDNPNLRLYQHLAGINGNPKKGTWVQQLLEEGVEPKMKILEIVDDLEQAREREVGWIQSYTEQGIQLTNAYYNAPEYKRAPRKKRSKSASVPVKPGDTWYMREGTKPREVRSILEYKRQKKMSTEQEVADLLGIPVSYLRQLAERHRIYPAVLPGWDVVHPNILYKGIDEPLYTEEQVNKLKTYVSSR